MLSYAQHDCRLKQVNRLLCRNIALMILLTIFSVLNSGCIATGSQQPTATAQTVNPQPRNKAGNTDSESSLPGMPKALRDEVKRLQHDDAQERAWAAYQIGKYGSGAGKSVPYLMRMLSDDSPVLLSRYMGGGFRSSESTSPAIEAARALAKIGSAANAPLIQALQSEDVTVRRLAVKALGNIGDLKSVDILIDKLSDSDRRVQAAAAIALGNYRHPIATQTILDRLASEMPAARAAMVYALAQINDVMSVTFLQQQLSQEAANPQVRAAIVYALGKLRDARAVNALLQSLKDPDQIVRANAAHALSAYFAPQVMEALIDSLGDQDEAVSLAAARALTQLTTIDLGTNQQAWRRWWEAHKANMAQGGG